MQWRQVTRVLDDLDAAGVAWWMAGGWGVDVLVGRETRPHRDLDLLVRTEHLDAALSVLTSLGYHRETDWLPVRVEYARPAGSDDGAGDDPAWVDVHPVAFDDEPSDRENPGHGVQADLDGGHFDYPAEVFTTSLLNGRRVPCLARDQQIAFHTGYEPRPHDLLDLALLRSLPPS